jgi:hypothetical protein
MYNIYPDIFTTFLKIFSWSSIRIQRHIIMNAFSSSNEVLQFSSNCNQIISEWSVVVALSNTTFPENISTGSRFVQCRSTDRQDKPKLFSKLFRKAIYNVRITAEGITSLLYVVMCDGIVSVLLC